MTTKTIYKAFTFFIALVWWINGFFCKVLGLVPRHEKIVAHILGAKHSFLFVQFIGWAEVVMSLWIVSRFMPRLCAITQIIVIALMNTLEFLLVPELLLWGRLNALFAFMFILIIFYHEFMLRKRVYLN